MMELLNTIFTKNLVIVSSFFGIFSLCVMADIIVKTFYNINNKGEDFSPKKMVYGLLRLLCLGAGTVVLSFVISTIPHIIPLVGIALSDEAITLFSVASVATVYINGITKYFKSAFDTVNKIVSGEKIFTELNDLIGADEDK